MMLNYILISNNNVTVIDLMIMFTESIHPSLVIIDAIVANIRIVAFTIDVYSLVFRGSVGGAPDSYAIAITATAVSRGQGLG